jgi:CRISPR-associated protein Cas8a1/Csx13
MSDTETYNVVKYEKEGLNKVIQKMIQTKELDKSREVLVKACHEALKNRYGQVKDRAKKERADLNTLFQREYEKLRVGLARCKNASTFRQELTDFWSRAGQLKTLQDGWSDVLPMLDEKNWAEARDLALLALASYKRPENPSDNQGT